MELADWLDDDWELPARHPRPLPRDPDKTSAAPQADHDISGQLLPDWLHIIEPTPVTPVAILPGWLDLVESAELPKQSLQPNIPAGDVPLPTWLDEVDFESGDTFSVHEKLALSEDPVTPIPELAVLESDSPRDGFAVIQSLLPDWLVLEDPEPDPIEYRLTETRAPELRPTRTAEFESLPDLLEWPAATTVVLEPRTGDAVAVRTTQERWLVAVRQLVSSPSLWLTLVLLAAVFFPPVSMSLLPNEDTVRAFGAINRLAPGSVVLVAVDYSLDRASDVEPGANALIRHLRARQASLVTVSTRPAGANLARGLLSGPDVTELGFIAGDAEGIKRLGRRDSASRGALPTDPALRRATGDRSVGLLVVLAGDQAGAARWLADFRRTAWPPAIAVLPTGDPWALAPLRTTGQLSGVISGAREAEGYLALAGAGPLTRTDTGQPTASSLALVLAALVAAAARLVRRRR